MNRMVNFKLILLLSIFIMQSSCAMFRKDPSTDRVKHAENISQAFAEVSAKTWRLGTARELAVIRTLPTKELDSALLGYRSVIAKRGAQGLEPLILAAVSELASRGYYESQRAQEHLKQLRKIYRIDDKVSARPNAYAPIIRPQNRLVHYIPLSVARGMLQQALISLQTGQNRIAADTLCSEASIIEFKLRWGEDKGNLLEELCRGDAANAAVENAFPGITSGISAYDCEISQEPTRAERLTSAMQACLQSTVTHGGGNPLTGGSPGGGRGYSAFDDIFPLPETEEPPREIKRATADANGSDAAWLNQENAYHIKAKDSAATGSLVTAIIWHYDGSIDQKYYKGNGDLALTVHIDPGQGEPSLDRGKFSSLTVHNADGSIKEKVTINKDNSYTVERPGENFKQTYDKDGKLVPPPPKSSDPSGWGDTDECRALTLALAEEKLRGDLESDGILSPKVVNPNPDAGGEDGEGVPCFPSINISIDSAMNCNQLVLCPGNTIADENCGCGQALPAVTPSSNCQYIMMCSDGSDGTENPQTGNCVCGNNEPPVFIDPWAGGGPEPEPMKGLNQQKDPFE